MRKDYLKGIKIIHEDRDILVIDKPPDLLTISSAAEKEKTAYHILTDYVRKGCSKSPHRVFIVHRLDRDTSGIVIFAKNERAKFSLQDHWDQTEKKYLTIVFGRLQKKADTLTSYLTENAAHMVYSTQNRSLGKLSTTTYNVLEETKEMSFLEVDLITGRKNQIRVHLAEIGHPVVGDQKYGRKNNAYRRMALHAYSISFLHPWNGKRTLLKTAIPPYFKNLLGGIMLEK